MKIRVPLLVLVCSVVLSTGCRQPDGPIPQPDAEDENRLSDLGRDLRAVARGETDAKKDFAEDLTVFANPRIPGAGAAVQAFANSLGNAVATATLTDESALGIARSSFTLVKGTELSDRQIKNLQSELRTELMSTGIPQDRADALIAELPTVQRAVTTRPRRWYEVF